MPGRDGRSVEQYPQELEDGSKVLGVDEEGSVQYWDPVREVTLGGRVSPDGDLSELEVRRELGMNESLDDVVREIEDAVGWDSLSSYAEGLLGEGDDGTDNGDSADGGDDGSGQGDSDNDS